MGKKELLGQLPPEGFIKVTRPPAPEITREQKAALIRRGNQLFQDQDVEQARKIFVSTGYTDGMIRLGDWYWDHDEPFQAFQMYKMAPYPAKIEELTLRMVGVIRKWLKENTP